MRVAAVEDRAFEALRLDVGELGGPIGAEAPSPAANARAVDILRVARWSMTAENMPLGVGSAKRTGLSPVPGWSTSSVASPWPCMIAELR